MAHAVDRVDVGTRREQQLYDQAVIVLPVDPGALSHLHGGVQRRLALGRASRHLQVCLSVVGFKQASERAALPGKGDTSWHAPCCPLSLTPVSPPHTHATPNPPPHLCAALYEEVHQLGSPIVARDVQRRPPVIVLGVHLLALCSRQASSSRQEPEA